MSTKKSIIISFISVLAISLAFLFATGPILVQGQDANTSTDQEQQEQVEDEEEEEETEEDEDEDEEETDSGQGGNPGPPSDAGPPSEAGPPSDVGNGPGNADKFEEMFEGAIENLQNQERISNMPESLSISPNGKARITGAEAMGGGDNFEAKVWDMTFNINASSAKIAGVKGFQDPTSSDISAGDEIMVIGEVNEEANSENLTIDAKMIKDKDLQKRERDERVKDMQNRLQQLLDKLENLRNNLQGAASSVF